MRRGLAALATSCALLVAPAAASAGVLTVNTTADESGAGLSCSLREALEAANTDGVFGGCNAGSDDGTDSIVLGPVTYGRTVPDELSIENENVIITGNGATIQGTDLAADGPVFGIFNVNATISDVTIRDGHSFVGSNGGGIRISDDANAPVAELNLRGSTVTSNTGEQGGGISSFFAAINLTNVTISGNVAGSGGGLDFDNGSSTLRNVTVTQNSSGINGGGGMYVTETTHTFLNTIVAGNTTTGTGPDCFEDPLATLVSAGHVLIGDPAGCTYTPGTGDLTGAAGLGPLATNGGPTPTHGLQPGSQAIDAGNPDTPDGGAFRCEPTDQRGVSRPVGARCDIGAFEGTLPLPPLPAPNVTPPPVTPTLGPSVLCASLRAKLRRARSKLKRKKIRRQMAKNGC